MARLGQYLCDRGLIGPEQLEEALQHQVIHGARLGTNLVDLRMIGVEQLAQCLSEYHGVRLPPRRWIERPSRAAIECVTRPLVERMRFVPMRLAGKVLHAAVLDPRDPGLLDDLRFATGCRIEPYVLPEVWMHEWLEQLFRVPRGIRYVDTSGPQVVAGDEARMMPGVLHAAAVQAPAHIPARAPANVQANVATSAEPAEAPPHWSVPPAQAGAPAPQEGAAEPDDHTTPDGTDEPGPPESVRPPVQPSVPPEGLVAPARPTLPAAPFLPSPPPLPRDAAATGPAQPLAVEPQVAAIASHATPGALAELERQMLDSQTRDAVIELALQLASAFAQRVALFSVHQGTIQGLRGRDGATEVGMEGVLVPLHADSMLAESALRAESARVEPSRQPIDARILGLLGEQPASQAAIFPVLIKQRVVNLLYADNASGALAESSFAALAALAAHMSRAYEQLILRRKTLGHGSGFGDGVG